VNQEESEVDGMKKGVDSMKHLCDIRQEKRV